MKYELIDKCTGELVAVMDSMSEAIETQYAFNEVHNIGLAIVESNELNEKEKTYEYLRS